MTDSCLAATTGSALSGMALPIQLIERERRGHRAYRAVQCRVQGIHYTRFTKSMLTDVQTVADKLLADPLAPVLHVMLFSAAFYDAAAKRAAARAALGD